VSSSLSSRPTDLVRLALAVVQPGFEGTVAPPWLLHRLEEGLGGVALFGRNVVDVEQLAALTAQVHEANPQALVAVDEEGGDVTRLEHATGSSWPGNLALGTVDDVGLTERAGREIGRLLAAAGVDLDYAPDADVNVEAANPVIGVRSFGSDAELVARHTAAWVTGLQAAGVLACAKHFPGHGGTRVDSHLDVPEADLGDPASAPALVPFRAAVDAGVAAVMSAHIRVPTIDPRPATLVPAVMTGLLRDHLGFDGLAVSDGLEMGAVARTAGLAEGAVLALAAGVDALCIGGDHAGPQTLDLVVDAIVRAVEDGRLSEERLAGAARRVAQAATLRHTLRDNASRPEAAADGNAGDGKAAGVEAATRALAVHGEVRQDAQAPLIVVLSAGTNIAVGEETPLGVVTATLHRWPAAQVVRASTPQEAKTAATRAAGRPLWLVVRDPHRHEWMDPAARAVAQVRPDAVVVDIGWPGWSPGSGLTHVVTHGASRASGEAVVRLLTGD
jgi:beta-N-acetylhexosaminidase